MIGTKGKGSIALIIIIAISLVISGTVFFLLQQEKSKTLQLSNDLSDTQAKNKSLQSQLDEVMNRVSELQDSLDDAKTQVSSLTAQLTKEKASKQESSRQIAALQQELDQQKALKTDLEKKLADSVQAAQALDARVKGMETQLKDLEAVKVALESKVKNFEDKKNVELGKIVVSQENTPAPAASAVSAAVPVKALEGKVLVLNKDYNFAVINLGNKDGVAVGNEFTVFHNNKPIADLKIEKVHEGMSAAGFAPELKGKIVEGDKVELKTK